MHALNFNQTWELRCLLGALPLQSSELVRTVLLYLPPVQNAEPHLGPEQVLTSSTGGREGISLLIYIV